MKKWRVFVFAALLVALMLGACSPQVVTQVVVVTATAEATTTPSATATSTPFQPESPTPVATSTQSAPTIQPTQPAVSTIIIVIDVSGTEVARVNVPPGINTTHVMFVNGEKATGIVTDGITASVRAFCHEGKTPRLIYRVEGEVGRHIEVVSDDGVQLWAGDLNSFGFYEGNDERQKTTLYFFADHYETFLGAIPVDVTGHKC